MKNGFLSLRLTLPFSQKKKDEIDELIRREDEEEERILRADEENGNKHHAMLRNTPEMSVDNEGGTMTLNYSRVFLHRSFPYENPYEFISVLNTEQEEVCMIKSVDEVAESDLIKAELDRKYYEPTIKKILEFRDDMGFSHWEVETEAGRRKFIVHDTFGSITHVSEVFVYVTDIDGNRYKIENLNALDKKSRQKIELFL